MGGIEIFDEVSLEIRSLGGDRFEAKVRTDGRAEVAAPFTPPFEDETLGPLLGSFDRPFSTAARYVKPSDSGQALPHARRVGDVLFEALFPGNVRRVFDQSLSAIDEVLPDGRIRGLRVRLQLDLMDDEVRPLAYLPWELLHDPLSHIFYGQGRMRLLVRNLAAPVPIKPVTVTPALRILAVASLPKDQPSLDIDDEAELVREALAGNDRIHVIPLEHATLEATRRALRRERPHVLHFMGHGDFDPRTGRGYLFFENGSHESDKIEGGLFCELMKDFPHVRLVVLNACRTAEMPRLRGQGPYTTVGAALSLSGVPAVVAMQFRVFDDSAILFAQSFYEALADGDPVDVATSDGRRALYLADPLSLEWAAPVLFLRARDGWIFECPRREGE